MKGNDTQEHDQSEVFGFGSETLLGYALQENGLLEDVVFLSSRLRVSNKYVSRPACFKN